MDEIRILIVEDSEFLGRIVENSLQTNGFETVWVKSYAEAREKLDETQSFFAAILDYSLPDALDGEIIGTVLEYKIPSIVFTGRVSNDVRDRIWESNVVDYFLKNDKRSLENIVAQLHRLAKNPSIKVLVVDDSSFYRKVVSDLLKVHRYDVLTAKDGTSALKTLHQSKGEIKLLITDYNMPDMNGIKVVQEARKYFGRDELAIIGISSEGENMMAVEFLKSDANDFVIKKRFLAEEFYTRVNQCLDYLENIQQIQEMNEQKNKLLGMAAHDLRNPLGTIRGFSELLRGDDLDHESQQELVTLIHSISDDMLVMLNDLLDVSHIESGKFTIDLKECNLAALIQDRVKLARISADKKDMQIVAELPDLPSMQVDRGKISQVLDNFISNAIKYSPLGTEIRCSLSIQEKKVRIGVRDQGPGISEEEQQKLFGEFSRLSTKATGGERSTGLGLAISKRIIEAHGGTVGVKSIVGEGSEFYFDLTTD